MKELVYQFIKQQRYGVLSSINSGGTPESALVGIAVCNNLNIVFDTLNSSRKYRNILLKPQVSMVIGWDDETSVQFEGEAEILGDDVASDNFRQIYFTAWPDGRERAETWPGLVHIKIKPKWIRYSNFKEPAVIKEIQF
jgi:general stress protein 26